MYNYFSFYLFFFHLEITLNRQNVFYYYQRVCIDLSVSFHFLCEIILTSRIVFYDINIMSNMCNRFLPVIFSFKYFSNSSKRSSISRQDIHTYIYYASHARIHITHMTHTHTRARECIDLYVSFLHLYEFVLNDNCRQTTTIVKVVVVSKLRDNFKNFIENRNLYEYPSWLLP